MLIALRRRRCVNLHSCIDVYSILINDFFCLYLIDVILSLLQSEVYRCSE